MNADSRFVREYSVEEARRQALLQNVSEVRGTMFTLVERAQGLTGSGAAVVDTLQACIYILGVVEARLRASPRPVRQRAH